MMKHIFKCIVFIVTISLFTIVSASRVPGGSSGSIGTRAFTANADGTVITVQNPDGTSYKMKWDPQWGYCMKSAEDYICVKIEGNDDKDPDNDVAHFSFYDYPTPPAIGPPTHAPFGKAKVKYKKK